MPSNHNSKKEYARDIKELHELRKSSGLSCRNCKYNETDFCYEKEKPEHGRGSAQAEIIENQKPLRRTIP